MSVYQCIHQISINNINFRKIVSVEINKSVESYTNTSKIVVPKNLKYNNQDVFTDTESLLFKKGDVVKIKLGYIKGSHQYFDTYQFEGFVSAVKVDSEVVEIECEDFMYWMKKTKFNFSAKKISLKELGNKIINEVNKLIPGGEKISLSDSSISMNVINFKAVNCTGVQILELLKNTYLLDSFFRSNVLHIGVNFDTIGSSQEVFTFSQYPEKVLKAVTQDKFYKIVDASDLNYVSEDDVNYSIVAKIFKSNGTVIEKKSGDESGEQRTFIFNGDYSDAEIQTLVDNQVKRIKYNGFAKGSSFTTFGKPDIDLLDIVSFDGLGVIKWSDNDSKNTTKKKVYKKASYLVDSVQLRYNTGEGFMSTIGLSIRVGIPQDNDSVALKIEGANKLLSF